MGTGRDFVDRLDEAAGEPRLYAERGLAALAKTARARQETHPRFLPGPSHPVMPLRAPR